MKFKDMPYKRVEKEELEKTLTGIMEEFKAASSGEEQLEIEPDDQFLKSIQTFERLTADAEGRQRSRDRIRRQIECVQAIREWEG